MHNSEVLEYLHSYADYYALREWIRFDTEVRQVSRTAAWPERSEWIVEYCPSSGAEHSKTEEFDAVMVCTGLYSKMYRPPEMRMEKKFKVVTILLAILLLMKKCLGSNNTFG